ncbi:uncharacterized protein LOC104583242 [Brachypodium distachyon]|nr:uncharacterized protein LOC104583242 [Brachypodium distachyon]|eukprot:XP_024314598.1 uncharacterized protein LOC104583242 [Brachypodium distachyon]
MVRVLKLRFGAAWFGPIPRDVNWHYSTPIILARGCARAAAVARALHRPLPPAALQEVRPSPSPPPDLLRRLAVRVALAAACFLAKLHGWLPSKKSATVSPRPDLKDILNDYLLACMSGQVYMKES